MSDTDGDPSLPMTWHYIAKDWRGVTKGGHLVIVSATQYTIAETVSLSNGTHAYRDPEYWIQYQPTACRVVSADTMPPSPVREHRISLRAILCLIRHHWVDMRTLDKVASAGFICTNCRKEYSIE